MPDENYGIQFLLQEKARLEQEQINIDDSVSSLQRSLDKAKHDQHDTSRKLAELRNVLKNLGVEQ